MSDTHFDINLQSNNSDIHCHIVQLTCYTVPRPYNDPGKAHILYLIYTACQDKLKKKFYHQFNKITTRILTLHNKNA